MEKLDKVTTQTSIATDDVSTLEKAPGTITSSGCPFCQTRSSKKSTAKCSSTPTRASPSHRRRTNDCCASSTDASSPSSWSPTSSSPSTRALSRSHPSWASRKVAPRGSAVLVAHHLRIPRHHLRRISSEPCASGSPHPPVARLLHLRLGRRRRVLRRRHQFSRRRHRPRPPRLLRMRLPTLLHAPHRHLVSQLRTSQDD